VLISFDLFFQFGLTLKIKLLKYGKEDIFLNSPKNLDSVPPSLPTKAGLLLIIKS
jgi:hypothetical protein